MYEIRFDEQTDVLHLRLSGFWNLATLAQFGVALLARSTMLRLRRRRFAVLSDSRDFPVQSGAVAAGFERMMERGMTMNMGPTAIVVGSMLNKIQAERTLGKHNARVFLDYEQACAWLAEERSTAPTR